MADPGRVLRLSSVAANTVIDVKKSVPVDAAPATSWDDSRPDDLAPQLWAGSRPTDESLAGLPLPEGSSVYGADGRLLGWESRESDRDLADLWLTCARKFPMTGLWPICDANELSPMRCWDCVSDDGKPDWLDPYAIPTDVYDVVNVADRVGYFCDPHDEPELYLELLEDCGIKDTSLTLARATPMPANPLSLLATPDGFYAPKSLTLVACRRPSDSVLLLDFGVPNAAATPGIFAGVLRSWEQRFGVVPVMLNPGWTSFQVLAPPTQEFEVERLATEVVSFAEDSAAQGGIHIWFGDNVTPQEVARSREWLIWWD